MIRKFLNFMLLGLLAAGGLLDRTPHQIVSLPALEQASLPQSQNVAANWAAIILQNEGQWAGQTSIQLGVCQELRREPRLLGYFCPVWPRGYIVTSLYTALTPVKIYSDENNLDLADEMGMVDFIKDELQRMQDNLFAYIEQQGVDNPESLAKLLEMDQRPSWAWLSVDASQFALQLASLEAPLNYQSGGHLLETNWHQGDPFNRFTPLGLNSKHTVVGCIATAASQIMKYWAWPPDGEGSHTDPWNGDGDTPGEDTCADGAGGTLVPGRNLAVTLSDSFDWASIPLTYTFDTGQNRWEDENGHALDNTNLDAVAELAYEVGVAANLDYGVCGTGATSVDPMDAAYHEHFRYSTSVIQRNRSDYTAIQWFDRMKAQFNINRPVQYVIYFTAGGAHSIVGDGWRETGNPVTTREYHMNYGWGDTPSNAFYILDQLPGVNQEFMLEAIVPVDAMGATTLSGVYDTQIDFNYRYFDRDASGSSASFVGYQNLQFLQNIHVSAASGGTVRFENSSTESLILFTRGDTNRGVHIYDTGVLQLLDGGAIKFK
jgi:hypothetical protein